MADDMNWDQSLDFEEGASDDFDPTWHHTVLANEETGFWIDVGKWQHPEKEDVITKEDLVMVSHPQKIATVEGKQITAEQFNKWIEAGPANPEPSDKFGDYDYE